MADQSIHLQQARHNQNLAKKLAKDKVRDWSVTCAFYSTLHYFEAVFIADPKVGHTEDKYNFLRLNTPDYLKDKSLHSFRDFLVDKTFPKVRSKLAQLRYMSESVRYLEKSSNKCGFDFINERTVKKALQDLDDIKSETQGS